jgi:hypothetical protein
VAGGRWDLGPPHTRNASVWVMSSRIVWAILLSDPLDVRKQFVASLSHLLPGEGVHFNRHVLSEHTDGDPGEVAQWRAA